MKQQTEMSVTEDVLPDVQSGAPAVALPIDLVGVRQLTVPLGLWIGGSLQHTVARVSLGASLDAGRRGTHMSRLVECVQDLPSQFDWPQLFGVLQQISLRLCSASARANFRFPVMLAKKAPGSGTALQAYEVEMQGTLAGNAYARFLALAVPIMTVCPCSQAISRRGAHSQRAITSLRVALDGDIGLGQELTELVALAESQASSEIYPLLKRPGEKYVTETAFMHPMFVEDVAREVASALNQRSEVMEYEVMVESMESIHGHNAFATVRSPHWPSPFFI